MSDDWYRRLAPRVPDAGLVRDPAGVASAAEEGVRWDQRAGVQRTGYRTWDPPASDVTRWGASLVIDAPGGLVVPAIPPLEVARLTLPVPVVCRAWLRYDLPSEGVPPRVPVFRVWAGVGSVSYEVTGAAGFTPASAGVLVAFAPEFPASFAYVTAEVEAGGSIVGATRIVATAVLVPVQGLLG